APTGDAVGPGARATANAMLTRLADREHGLADSALDYWSELLALLRCEPLAHVPRTSGHDRALNDPWDGLRRLAQIERVRLSREKRPNVTAPVGGHLKPGLAGQQMVWPVEKERWTDELPMPAVVSRCVAPPAAATADAPETIDAGPATDPEIALVSSAARLLPADHPATPLLLVQAAVLDIARGDALGARLPLGVLEQMAPTTL